jgi:hypothetical protein
VLCVILLFLCLCLFRKKKRRKCIKAAFNDDDDGENKRMLKKYKKEERTMLRRNKKKTRRLLVQILVCFKVLRFFSSLKILTLDYLCDVKKIKILLVKQKKNNLIILNSVPNCHTIEGQINFALYGRILEEEK